MKKTILITALISCMYTANTYAQWTYKLINNDFDGSFKKAYTETIEDKYFMILEEGDTSVKSNFIPPILGIYGSHWCETDLSVDVVFKSENANSTVIKNLSCYLSDNDKYIIFRESIWTDEFIRLFCSATEMKIRVNQSICDSKYITVAMKNFKDALMYMSNKNVK